MEIIKLNLLNPDRNIFKKIKNDMSSGSVLLYPSDTCYGLSCVIDSQPSIKKILEIKRRPAEKSMSIAFCDLIMLDKYAYVNNHVRKFIRKYLPGAITLIVPSRKEAFIKEFPMKRDKTIAVRIPGDIFTRKLIQSIGKPIITTSANISGFDEKYNFDLLLQELLSPNRTKDYSNELPDIVIAKERIAKNPPSTIIDTTVSPWKVIREGRYKVGDNGHCRVQKVKVER